MGEFLVMGRIVKNLLNSSAAFLPGSDSAVLSVKGTTATAPNKPRILMVGMHLTKTRGGITTLAADILNSDLKTDHDFIYIASQAEDLGGVGKALLAMSATLRFVAQCILKRPQLVYIHIGSNASLYRESAFVVLARLFRLPVISHFHAGDVDLYMARQTRVGKWFIRSAIGLSSRVIAVSNESARQLADLNDGLQTSMIPNAIDTSTFLSVCRQEEAARGSVRLLFVGTFGGQAPRISCLSY